MTLHMAVGTRACCITVVVGGGVVAAAHLKCPKPAKHAWGAISVLRKQRENAWGQFCFLGGNIVGAISAW